MPSSKVPKPNAQSKQRKTSTKPKPREDVKKPPKKRQSLDTRKQLFNEGVVGPIEQVQVSKERIAKLNGILFDVDPCMLKQGPLLPNLTADPVQFFEQCVRSWLERHPVLDALEIRVSGTGLHGILWLEPAAEFADDAVRDRWCAIVKVVQAALPTDPRAPGITATTRATGSINTKNNERVRLLKKGGPISPSDVIALQEQMCRSPFKTLFGTLTGSDRMSPCPICGGDESTLVALDHIGKCYKCGKVTFDKLCEQLYQAKTSCKG